MQEHSIGLTARIAATVRAGLLRNRPALAAAVTLLFSAALVSAAPPVHLGTTLPGGKDSFTAGDSLRIETVWQSDSPIDSVTADLRSLIAHGDTLQRFLATAEAGTWLLRTRLPSSGLASDGSGKRITITASSAEGATSDTTLHVTLDTVAPAADSLALDFVPGLTARDSLEISGRAPGADSVDAREGSALQFTAPVDPASRRFSHALALPHKGVYNLDLTARDRAGNETPWPVSPIVIDRIDPPQNGLVLVRWAREDTLDDGSVPPLHNRTSQGDPASTLRLLTEWGVPDSEHGADDLEILPDFSALDGPQAGETTILQDPGHPAVYHIVHRLADGPGRADGGNIPIPLTATGAGVGENDTSIHVCLSNHPPRHRSTLLLPTRAHPHPLEIPYRSGDSLLIETVWHSDSGLPLSVTPDFRSIEVDSLHAPLNITTVGDSTFLIIYRIPLRTDYLQPDGPGKIIPITAHDSGCGRATDFSLQVDLDTEPPDTNIVIDPLPSVTTRDSIEVRGIAPGAYRVEILRNLFAIASTFADSSTGAFRVQIELVPGLNRIQARALDRAGNGTLPLPLTAPTVTRVSGTELSVALPYSRKEKTFETTGDIVLRSPEGMTDATIRVFNLEGDCVWEEVAPPGVRQEFGFHWKGTDRAGNRSPQGYYLVRAQWKSLSGRIGVQTHGLLLKD